MIASDFRRIALSFEGAEEGSHMGQVDFRVGGRIFATLASQKMGFGNLMLSPEQQTAFITERPHLFIPIAGGWERMAPRISGLRMPMRTPLPAHCALRGTNESKRIKGLDRGQSPHGGLRVPLIWRLRGHGKRSCARV